MHDIHTTGAQNMGEQNTKPFIHEKFESGHT